MDLRLMILKKFGPQGSVCLHPVAIYMYITVIFKDLLLSNGQTAWPIKAKVYVEHS